MDFSNPLGIEHRVVSNAMRDGEPVRIVSGAKVFDADVEELWDALTNPERIPNWFLPISGELQTGGRYQLEGNAGGSVIRCEPPENFELSWECGGNISWVHVFLESVEAGTRLTLEHSMQMDAASEEHWTKFGPGATGVGWDLGFVLLDLHLRTGETVLQAESEKWMSSSEGKDFSRDSARLWGEAHIAGGESPEIAHGMAEETAKAYTGEG